MAITAKVSPVRGLRPTYWLLIFAATWPVAPTSAAPAAGDAYLYQVVNGYNKEVRGKVQYEVDGVDANRVSLSAVPDSAEAGWARKESYTLEGNWLHNVVESHGVPVEYEFTTAYPAFVFPLDPGKSWSVRVNATVPGTTGGRSVRVDGTVIGNERIRVPAGEFDTIKVKRRVYPGDADFMRTETYITEFDWYAPALGRPVRTERRSYWTDLNQCGFGGGACEHHGNWDVIELVTAPAKR